MHCMLPWSHAVLLVFTSRQIQECLAEMQSLRLYLFRSPRNSFSSKVLQNNRVYNIISMTFVHFKLCMKRCRPKPYSLFLVNVCNRWRRQIPGFVLENFSSLLFLKISDFVLVQELDEAARRRMPKQLYIPLPCAAARRQMIERQLGQSRLACLLHDLPSRSCHSLSCMLPVKPSCLRLFVIQWRVLCNPVGRYSCDSKLV